MIETKILDKMIEGIEKLYDKRVTAEEIQLQKTKREFEGDITIVVFTFTKYSKKSAEATANEIGTYLISEIEEIEKYSVIKGFLNLLIKDTYWLEFFNENLETEDYGIKEKENTSPIVIEYSSPNTNKPLHLGHIRNNLLGYSISEILKANGKNVIKVNLVNDRGIHICKSMLAWQKWGNGETPESAQMKGDHLVGKYYIMFDTYYKSELDALLGDGLKFEEAEKQAPLILEAQELLRKWENNEADVISLWKQMNGWVYEGFNETYKNLGIDFDKTYYESNTYLLGKELVREGEEDGKFYKKADGTIFVDLTSEGLDEKVLLRADGTSVYITQDLGTAEQRYKEFKPQKMVYVVGNEQNYHFEVLQHLFRKLNKPYADSMFHLSYGMVELPEGKMKSREGTVVDADDLIEEMFNTAKKTTTDLGKVEEFTTEEAEKLYKTISLGALKYFILKVDPQKNMLFNPQESIDFNGNTGPFIQYTYARIQSLLRKATANNLQSQQGETNQLFISPKEKYIIKLLHEFPKIIEEAANSYSPAILANYTYELAKEYNQFYQEVPVLRAETDEVIEFRLKLSDFTGKVIKSAMRLLGIEVPVKM